jgi:hypothetical protein
LGVTSKISNIIERSFIFDKDDKNQKDILPYSEFSEKDKRNSIDRIDARKSLSKENMP